MATGPKDELSTQQTLVYDGHDVADPTEMVGSVSDSSDMYRMGKSQQLKRNFRFVSILGFSCIAISTWEGVFNSSAVGLVNGGLAGLIWTFLGTFISWSMVVASMAEIASMAPTSGGQFHWVSEFAPPSASRFLSYVTGWLCILGWQTVVTSVAYTAAVQVQSLLVINDPDYVFQNWHGTFLTVAFSFFAFIFNTFLASKLPAVGGLLLVLHVIGFFAILIPLWVLAPRGTGEQVFTEFTDGGGWGNIGLACLIGMLSPVYSLMCPDSASHMSEEIRDASLVLPRAMMTTLLVNGSLGFIMLVTFCYCLGDVNDILSNAQIVPFVQVFFNVTNSYAATAAMTAIICILTVSCLITTTASASRQLFAFARDRGVPYSAFISHIRPGWDIPLNAVIVSICFTIILSLINIGSNLAFNIIASIGVAALVTSYIISITCVRVKRWREEPLPYARWSLGRYGAPINDFSILYLSLVFNFLFFPSGTPVVPLTMNWNIVIYAFTLLSAIGFYFIQGRHTYASPVTLVRKNL